MAVNLMNAYHNIRDLFNAWNYNDLVAAMDANIVVKKVQHPDSISGIGNVSVYLNSQMLPLKPTFTNHTDIAFHPNHLDAQASATYGLVRGVGDYVDNTVKGDKAIKVFFVWSFTRSYSTEDWMLVNVFGTPIGG
jgi:hypothetical protein